MKIIRHPNISSPLAAFAAAVTVFLAHPAPAGVSSYANPLPFSYESQGSQHKDLRDPCIIRDKDTYYAIFTMWPFRNRDEKHFADPDLGSSPGIRMYSTHDFKTWKEEGWLAKSSDLPEDCPYKHQFWAPEIHKLNGKFYLIFTASNWNAKQFKLQEGYYAFIGVSDKVTGPYAHITKVPNGPCDTSLFTDEKGEFYLAMPRQDIFVQKVDLGKLDQGIIERVGQEKKVVMFAGSDTREDVNPKYLEGPWVERIGGKFCLFYAACYPNRIGYWTGVAYADNPMGPYTKDPRGRVFFGGHLSIFDGPDGRKWFSYRKERPGIGGGQLCIDPFDFDANGRVQAVDTVNPPVSSR